MNDLAETTDDQTGTTVLLVPDICRVLKTSPRSVHRRLAAGTFPIRPLPGIDKKYRWSPQAVRRFLETGRKVG